MKALRFMILLPFYPFFVIGCLMISAVGTLCFIYDFAIEDDFSMEYDRNEIKKLLLHMNPLYFFGKRAK